MGRIHGSHGDSVPARLCQTLDTLQLTSLLISLEHNRHQPTLTDPKILGPKMLTILWG